MTDPGEERKLSPFCQSPKGTNHLLLGSLPVSEER